MAWPGVCVVCVLMAARILPCFTFLQVASGSVVELCHWEITPEFSAVVTAAAALLPQFEFAFDLEDESITDPVLQAALFEVRGLWKR